MHPFELLHARPDRRGRRIAIAKVVILLLALLLISVVWSAANAQPIGKVQERCPLDYYERGGYCYPRPGAKIHVPKGVVGCPSGFRMSSNPNYCVKD